MSDLPHCTSYHRQVLLRCYSGVTHLMPTTDWFSDRVSVKRSLRLRGYDNSGCSPGISTRLSPAHQEGVRRGSGGGQEGVRRVLCVLFNTSRSSPPSAKVARNSGGR
eukprot:967395-Prorocentrum_minimum.AAC.4